MKLSIPGQVEVEIDNADYSVLQKIANSDFVGLIGADWLKLWRWNNLTKIAEKVRKKCEKSDLDPKQVAPKFINQFFESASLEEDETIQEMWANLLLNKSINNKINTFYIQILKELEPQEAEILNGLFKVYNGNTNSTFVFDKVMQVFNINKIELEVMVQKLYGFNIFRPPLMSGIMVSKYPIAVETMDNFRFSEMGVDFLKKCNEVTNENC
jgi:hypothetical protein